MIEHPQEIVTVRSSSPVRRHAGAERVSLITDRQLECLAWVQEGKSASDIGVILGVSGRTVEGHLIKLCGHLGVKTRVQAVVLARQLGLISREEP